RIAEVVEEIGVANAALHDLLVLGNRRLVTPVAVVLVGAGEQVVVRLGDRRQEQERETEDAPHAANSSVCAGRTRSMAPRSARTRRRAARISPGPEADGAKRAKSQFSSSRTRASTVSSGKPRRLRRSRS